MSFENYESQKKLQAIQCSILKHRFTIEKKSKAITLEALLEMESELQLCFSNIMECISEVNINVQSIQNSLIPSTVEHLNISRSDAPLFRQLFQNSMSVVELLESIKHKCSSCCSFNPMENKQTVSLNEIRKMYIHHFKMLKIGRTLCKSVLLLINESSENTLEKVDDLMKTYISDSTINSFRGDSVYSSSPILKEKTDGQNEKDMIEF